MEQKENFDDVTDESQQSIREMTFSSAKKTSVFKKDFRLYPT